MAVVAALGIAAATGCAATDTGAAGQSPEQGVVVPPGKEDNFLSDTAQEYMVEGTTTVTIEPELAGAPEAQKLARVRELIGLKQIVVGWFLSQYLGDKEHDDSNAGYGGFSSLTKNGSYEDLNIEAVDSTTYRFTLRQEIGGGLDLLDKLPTEPAGDGRRSFALTIGKISNEEMARLETNHEWYRNPPWSSFDPTKVDASRLDTVTLTIWAEPRSVDAWLDYQRLFEDGKLTVDVYFGWDYHSEYHLKHSREIYQWLVDRQHFHSPVGSYDEYGRSSGPLTKTIDAGGRAVEVEVDLEWGKPGTELDPDTDAGGKLLEQDMRASFRDHEVVMFSGHSGPFYGFALANWRKTDEGDLDDSEIADLEMPPGVYQIVVAEGCDTYALGQGFRNNPAKPELNNVDVVTTTSFSNASTASSIKASLSALIGGVYDDAQEPVTFKEYLRDMDNGSYWFDTMYGVHGIDDNPHAHPYANVDRLCASCTSDADCGGVGNACSRLGDGERFCSFACTSDDGCPDGYRCMAIAYSGTIKSHQCAPTNLTCEAPPPEPVAAEIIINEVFASPKPNGGDANADGIFSYTQDEFVELLNVGQAGVDLSGWTLSDGYMTRLVFPNGTKLAPGKALVVFAGGDAASFGPLGGAGVVVSHAHGLGLNNSGDTLTLADDHGESIDQMSYDASGGQGVSMVREQDGNADAPFVLHPGGLHHSAGTRQDGAPF